MTTMRFGPYHFDVSDTDKVLFPEAGLTKGDLIHYHTDMAEHILRHCRERPLALHRFPDGVDSDGFFQQNRADYFPDWIHSVNTPRSNNPRQHVDHVVANNRATLAYLASQAVITLHGWLSREQRLRRPDRLIFDLDPIGDRFETVVQAAQRVRDLMEQLGMHAYVMTTGSRGLHVVAPIRPQQHFDRVRDYATAMADHLARSYSDSMTTEQRKQKREGRLYLDVMRNAYGQTAVLPYSVRPRSHAPVATPLHWEELGDGNLHAQRYTVKNISRRLGQISDPWHDMRRHAIDIAGLPDLESL